MNRRSFLRRAGRLSVLPATAALSASARAQESTAAAADRPNILLVLTDDHSNPHVGCYGNADIRTPNLDRFAAEGMRFERAYVTSPQCVPSRASLMSGRSPVGIQMTRFSAPLPADVPIYPEALRRAGYYTGLAGRTYHLDGSRVPMETERVFRERNLRTMRNRLDSVRTSGGRADESVRQFAEFLDAVPKGKPFFLQLGFSEPHRPLDKNAIPDPHDPAKLRLPTHFPDTPLVREDFARYYDEISRFDAAFGRVMNELERRGLEKNTLVVFMGDNGGALLRGKGTLYELGIRVPLLVRWPDVVRPGASADTLISGEDLGPTLLDAAGLSPLPGMTGKSFLPLLRGQQQAFTGRSYAFSERGAHGSGLPSGSGAFDLGRCVVSPTHKLIYNALWQIPYSPVDFAGSLLWKDLQARHAAGTLGKELGRIYFSSTRPMFELYNLKADPSEMNNLVGKADAAAVEKDLKSALQEWMIVERDFLPLPVPPPPQRGGGGSGTRRRPAAS